MKRYGKDARNDNSDAFIHSYWSALMTFHTSKDYEEEFAAAHEKDWYKKDKLERDMDRVNNYKGREISISNSSKYARIPNPLAKNPAIAEGIEDAVDNGEMVRWKGSEIGIMDKLVRTNDSGEKW